MAFNRRAGAGRLPAARGLIEVAISKSASTRAAEQSVTSEPLFGAERRPQSPTSIVLRFKSARSNRKASKRAEPANHAKGERSQSPRERVAAFAAPLEACESARKSARGIGIERKETASATRAARRPCSSH